MALNIPKPKKGSHSPSLEIYSKVETNVLTPDPIEDARLSHAGGFAAKIETVKIKKSKK